MPLTKWEGFMLSLLIMAGLFNLKLTQEMERNTEEERKTTKGTRNKNKLTVSKGKGKTVEEESATVLERRQDTQYMHRCVSFAFNKTIKLMTLPSNVVTMLSRSPFAHFINLPICKIHTAELNKLLNQKLQGNNFKLGRSVLQFTVEDVACILHLKNEGLEIREKKRRAATSTIEHLFRNESKIRRWSVEFFFKAIREGDLLVDDTTMAQLWISFLFSTFLIPDSSSGFDPSILEYIGDVDGIGRYNWAAYVYQILMNSLETVKTYCLGCAWALMVWAYKHNPNLQPTNNDDVIVFRQWSKISPNINNILTCENVKVSSDKGSTPAKMGSSHSGFSIRMPRLEEELAMSKQENERLKCRVLQLEEENKSLRDHISQKNVAESSTKNKGKEEEKQVKQPTPAPAGSGPSSMVRRIKMGARKRNIVKQVENSMYTNKRKKNFSGKNAVTDSECERIQHFLSNNIKYFGPQKFEINSAECSGMDISDMIMGKCTCSRIIDVYMEIIKRNYHSSGVKGVYFMDSFASQYIGGDTDCDEEAQRSNINKMKSLLSQVLCDIRICRKILMPIYADFHWHLLEIDFQGKAFRDYNSLKDRRNDTEVGRLQDWLSLFDHTEKLGLKFHEWDLVVVQSFPQQKEDSLDCGIFMLKAMEKISMDQQIDFKKKDISRLRCEMAVEILTSSVRG